MRRWAGLAVVATVGAVAAGCMGGGSHHGTLSAKDALAQARDDGFAKPAPAPPGTWRCTRTSGGYGAVAPAGVDVRAVRPTYALAFGDRRVPDGAGNSARIAMMLVVFPNERIAQRCAEAAIYQAMHSPVDTSGPTAVGPPYRPYKVIDPTTVETAMHAPGAPGFVNAVDDGVYETWFARGRVFALGVAYNGPHSKIVRQDLQRLAAEIAG